MAYFLMRLIPPRPTFPADATEAEVEAMGRHAEKMQELVDRGVVVAAGPVRDPQGTWGVAIVEAADEAAARELGAADPVVRAGLGFHWQVLPMGSLLAPGR